MWYNVRPKREPADESIPKCSCHLKVMKPKSYCTKRVCVCARTCAFNRTVRTCLLSFKEQTEVILTRPRSLGTQLSIPISFIGCPNSVSSFLEEEVRDRRNAKCSIQQDFLTDTVKVMHHKVLLIRLHYSSWIEKLSVLKGQCTRIMERHIFTLSLEFAIENVALKAPCSRGKKRKDRYDAAD